MFKCTVIVLFLLLTFNVNADEFGNEVSDALVIEMAKHYISQFNGVSAFLSVLGFVVGFVYIFRMLLGLPKLADRNNQEVTGFGLILFAFTGALLMYISTSQLIVYESVFGSVDGTFESPFNYSMQQGVSFSGTAEEANALMIKQFFKMIGAIAFLYGTSLIPALDRAHPRHQDVTLGKVLTYTISGVLSMAPDLALQILMEFIPYFRIFAGE
jgi:hypothetical protein